MDIKKDIDLILRRLEHNNSIRRSNIPPYDHHMMPKMGVSEKNIPIKDHHIVDVIKPNMNNGPWIAGGAALSWYQNQPANLSDIDIFCKNERQAALLCERLQADHKSVLIYNTTSAKTFEFFTRPRDVRSHVLQVVTIKYFDSIQDVLNHFDISVCKVGTDGVNFVLGENAAYDIKHKILRMNQPFAKDAIKRLVKYWIYGYHPSEELYNALVNDNTLNLVFSPGEDYLNAF